MGINQSDMRQGRKYSKRRGIYGGPLNRRRQGTVVQFDEWIANCIKEVEEGKMDLTRGRKIVSRWWALREKKRKRLERTEGKRTVSKLTRNQLP